jgi:hypothetical protein
MVRLALGGDREYRQAVIDRERDKETSHQEKKEESRTQYVLAPDRSQALGKLSPPRFHVSQQIVLFELLRNR